MPTLISDTLEAVAAAIAATDEAIEAGVPGILGRHIEGPFLNLARRGIHDAGRIRRIDSEAIALLSSAKHGRTLVTLAPECVHPDDIAALTKSGVIVAAGHTEADFDTVNRAVAAGLTGVTHLFNAMPPLFNRAPGLVGATFDNPALIAGLIVDGHHLHPAVVRLAWKLLGPDRLMLVTDAMPTTGGNHDTFDLHGQTIFRREGRLIDEAGTLAGSTLDMAEALRKLIEMTGASLADAVIAASATPATFLGLAQEVGAIRSGLRADLVVMDASLREVRRIWIGGKEYPA